MRKLFALTLIALLLGVGIVAIIETDPGYVLVSYGNYTLESSLWVGLLLLLLLVLSLYFIFRLIYRFVGGQRTLVTWLGTRKAHHAQRLSTRGLISYTEGNWAKARRQLQRGVDKNEAPLMNHLLAARASDYLQEPEKIHQHLSAATTAEPDAAVAVEITLAEMKLRAGEFKQALAALDKADINRARYPGALQVMLTAYRGMQHWDSMLALLPEVKKSKLLSADAFANLEVDVHRGRLAQAASGSGQLSTVWQSMPARLKQDAAMLQAYVVELVATGDYSTAEKIILRALKQDWSSDLVRQYGLVQSDNAAKQLAQAESWLAKHPDDVQLLLCLGRLSARDKLWGKARDYFESSYRLERSAEVCAELGRLLTELGEPKVAGAYFREGLLQSERNLPELPMPDKVVPDGQLLARS